VDKSEGREWNEGGEFRKGTHKAWNLKKKTITSEGTRGGRNWRGGGKGDKKTVATSCAGRGRLDQAQWEEEQGTNKEPPKWLISSVVRSPSRSGAQKDKGAFLTSVPGPRDYGGGEPGTKGNKRTEKQGQREF